MVMYFPTAFSIIAHCWQLNSNHDVNFLPRFLGLVACMPITSIEPRVHNALMADWHSLQQSSQNLFLTLQSIYRI